MKERYPAVCLGFLLLLQLICVAATNVYTDPHCFCKSYLYLPVSLLINVYSVYMGTPQTQYQYTLIQSQCDKHSLHFYLHMVCMIYL